VDYTATATLAGSLSSTQAERIVRQLAVYTASVTSDGRERTDRFKVRFTLHAGSDREAVIRALSATDDLGYRLIALEVLP